MANILIVDQETQIVDAFSSVLESAGHTVRRASSLGAAEKPLSEDVFSIVIADLDEDGFEVMGRAKQRNPEGLVILTTAIPTKDTALRALREGAFDYLVKPLRVKEFVGTIERGLNRKPITEEEEALQPALAAPSKLNLALVGDSSAVRSLRTHIDTIRESKFQPAILLQGPSGSFKMETAESIHQMKRGAGAPLVKVDCSSLSESGLADGLIGPDEAGGKLFDEAEGGTLVLDKIETLPEVIQEKLERVCHSASGRVLLICNSDADLDMALTEGSFNMSLYFQIAAKVLEFPALEDHVEDIPDLARAILLEYPELSDDAREVNFTDDALEALKSAQWDGHLRQFQEVIVELASKAGDGEVRGDDVRNAVG